MVASAICAQIARSDRPMIGGETPSWSGMRVIAAASDGRLRRAFNRKTKLADRGRKGRPGNCFQRDGPRPAASGDKAEQLRRPRGGSQGRPEASVNYRLLERRA